MSVSVTLFHEILSSDEGRESVRILLLVSAVLVSLLQIFSDFRQTAFQFVGSEEETAMVKLRFLGVEKVIGVWYVAHLNAFQ